MCAECRRLLSVVEVCALACFISASAPVLRAQNAVPQRTQEGGLATPDEYLLAAGDALSIKFFYNPELNEQLPIRPDGRIALQLIGDVRAAGLRVSELRVQLVERYGQVLRDPDLVVIVSGFGAQRIYVGGEVARPGEIPLVPGMTPLQAIIVAGGDRRTASMRNVIVVRDQGTDTPQLLLVDIKKSLATSGETQEIRLQARDIVFVPMSKIGKVDNFVSQYVKELVPMSIVLGLYYNFGGFLQP